MEWIFLGLIVSGLAMFVKCVELIVNIETLTKDIKKYMPEYLSTFYIYDLRARILFITVLFIITFIFGSIVVERLP